MTELEHKRLVIDLDQCGQCEGCAVNCGYYDRRGRGDSGILGLREYATFELVCRRCEHASCVIACPFDALERVDGRVIKRHNLRCVSCKLCAHACPFGTIYPDMLTFYASMCDGCTSRAVAEPQCVSSCSQGALAYRVVGPDEPDVHIINEHLAAATRRWVRREEAA